MPPKASLRDRYEQLVPIYEKLVEEVKYALNRQLGAAKIKIASLEGRVKTTESFLEKADRKDYSSPLEDTEDIAGVRVVCLFEIDVEMVGLIIRNLFAVEESENKTESLGLDRMGYQGDHHIIKLASGRFSGPRYDDLTGCRCEIQVRTVLQDAWAQLSHHLVYKSEASIPDNIKRQLYNVSSLLEVAQGVFDDAERTRENYVREIDKEKSLDVGEFLSRPVDRDTLEAYTRWKYPNLPISGKIQELLIRDLNKEQYRTLGDLDRAIEEASDAVQHYKKDKPEWFKNGTDFITKSLGFVDKDFRARHPFAPRTREAFSKYGHLVRSNG